MHMLTIDSRRTSLTNFLALSKDFPMYNPMDTATFQKSVSLFELSDDYDLQALSTRYQKLLYTWHPARYASLTNNPRKYMEMYKKGEAKTKEIHASYKILLEKLEQ